MEQRIVKLQIANEFIIGSGVSIGAVGSHDDVLLEMDFRNSAPWAGTTRRAIFSNALGENRTPILLTHNLLAEGHSEVYLVPVPAAAKDVAGECFLTVEGFISEGEKEILRIVTEEAMFRVLPSKLYHNESQSITPSEVEQLQAAIAAIVKGASCVYVGSGDMPEGYTLQIDPYGSGIGLGDMPVEVTKAFTDSHFLPNEVNGWRSAVVLSRINVPEGYDRIRIRSIKIPVKGSGTVRFAACTVEEDGDVGTLTVEDLLGDAVASDGVAELVTAGSYTADHGIYITAFADTDMIGGCDLTGAEALRHPQIAENIGVPESAGGTFPITMDCWFNGLEEVSYDAIRDKKTLNDILVEINDRLARLE